MGLEADEAVDDVGAGLLQLARPDDVRLLVEAGLDLDEDDDLLALLGGPDQVAHDRRVARRPVERLLDRQDVGVVGGLGDEALDRRGERLVGVVDEEVALPDRGEDVDALVLVARARRGGHDGRPGRVAQVREVERRRSARAQVRSSMPADLVEVVGAQADARRGGTPASSSGIRSSTSRRTA